MFTFEARITRRLKGLGVGVGLLVGLLGAVPTASAGGPPEDRVTVIGPIVDEVVCDGTSITRTGTGWLGLPADHEDLFRFNIRWEYSNAAGSVWTYIDTGIVRGFERDGQLYVALSGRSTNVGPDGTGWVGHWELNTGTNEVSRVGLGVGAVDQVACSRLT